MTSNEAGRHFRLRTCLSDVNSEIGDVDKILAEFDSVFSVPDQVDEFWRACTGTVVGDVEDSKALDHASESDTESEAEEVLKWNRRPIDASSYTTKFSESGNILGLNFAEYWGPKSEYPSVPPGLDPNQWDKLLFIIFRQCLLSYVLYQNTGKKHAMPFAEAELQTWIVPLLQYALPFLWTKDKIRVVDATGKPKLFSESFGIKAKGFTDIIVYINNIPILLLN
jgi:hypothetical protein